MALQGGGGGERGGHVSGYVSGHVSGHVSASASAQGSGLQFESMMMQHEVATPASMCRRGCFGGGCMLPYAYCVYTRIGICVCLVTLYM